MNRKRPALGLSVFLLLVAGAGFLAYRLSRSEINRDNFERITVGMRESEVEAIFGGPERDETDGACVPNWFPNYPCGVEPPKIAGPESSKLFHWMSDEGWIGLRFDEQGRVCGKLFSDVRRFGPTWFERVKAYLGL